MRRDAPSYRQEDNAMKLSFGSIVAAAVIVVVVSLLLLPVFAQDRETSQKSQCQSNLKQCAQALKMYADDYDGTMPSSYLVSGKEHWNRNDFLRFATLVGNRPPKTSPRQTWPEILYDNMRSKDIMFCPSDPVSRNNPNAQASYWYKTANDKAWYGLGCPEPRKKMDDYGYESDQIAFYEHQPWHFGGSGGLKNGTQINASFVDTHVETIVIKNATSANPVNCAANSYGEPMYYNLRVDDRGKTKSDTGPARQIDPTFSYDTL
jgi:type II secretory pathway pseudopilin PulG